jgi:pyrroloquinoline quinone (PQQ) biosynthesis protein C
MTPLNRSEQLQDLAERLRPLYDRIANHPLYRSFENLQDLHLFLETHVFAVWDFMSLLKALQRGLTCVDTPWLPSRYPESRRLVNEIVLGEESDIYGTQALSHFELYLLAMREAGASTDAIDSLVAQLREGSGLAPALALCGAPEPAQRFVHATFQLIERGELHTLAAAFTFGREDLIPEMFRSFIHDLDTSQYNADEITHRSLATLRWYLDRHIEVDGEDHGPMALRMVSELCGDDPRKWSEAAEAAETALRARLALWDGIAASLELRPTLSVH